jgi:hypothetical protein
MEILTEWVSSALDFRTDSYSPSDNRVPIVYRKRHNLGDANISVACYIWIV